MATNPAFHIIGHGHTGMTVRSMAKSLRFWKDILGFQIIWQQDVPGSTTPSDPVHTMTGAPLGTSMRVVWIQLKGSDPGRVSTLELIEYELPPDVAEEQKSRTPHARSWDIGSLHINLMIQGLDQIVESVKSEGFQIY
ncbi:hypothetical protein M406DRAFT_323413, partial [Cryphonectria parasitica EP155]